MNRYSLPTTWRLRAPIDRVWEAIYDYEAWPSWWPAIQSATRVTRGGENGVGEVSRFVFRAPFGYKLRFQTVVTHCVPPHELDGRSTGDLEGTGRWRLSTESDGTVVHYRWNVRTTIWWMNLLAPILRPLFIYSHRRVMKEGGKRLARLLARRVAAVRRPPR